MKVLGIDLGSREVKVVIMKDRKIIRDFKISTMSFYRDYCDYDSEKGIIVNFKKLNLDDDLDRCISTGYGRNNVNLNNFIPINEIKAHVYGAVYQLDLKDFVLLDIGGQDVKVVKVEKGLATDLELNEKCAASCGRFLENMANVLEVEIKDLYKYHKNPIELSSTCAVFSESELIGKIAEGVSLDNLCAGVNYSMFKRIEPMLDKFRASTLVLSGGVARNTAIKTYLEGIYEDVIVLKEPQLNGAIGCCYYGTNKRKGKVI